MPGTDGYPSRADSREGAAAANDISTQATDEPIENEPDTAQPDQEASGEQDSTAAQDGPEPWTASAPDHGESVRDARVTGERSDTGHAQAGTSGSSDAERRFEEAGAASDAGRQQQEPDNLAVPQDGTRAAEAGEPSALTDSTEQQQEDSADPPEDPSGTAEGIGFKTDDGEADSGAVTPEKEADRETSLDSSSGSHIDAGRKGVAGDGLSDDIARVADHDDSAVERGIFSSLKRAFTPEQSDQRTELVGVVDRPDFQDPLENPRLVPDRYGTPLERSDGARTPLFDGEPMREQTKQGDLGDCGIIATLGAVAGHRPEAIRDCVRETDDGNYEVRLHEAKYSSSRMRYEPTGRPVTLTVTPDLPVHADDPGKPAFADSTSTGAAWAPVLEKAVAGTDQTWNDERRQKWSDRWDVQGNGGDAPTGYVRLNQGSNPSDRAELLTQLTGKPAKSWEFPTGYDHNGRGPDRQLLEDFRKQLGDSKPILVGTRDLRAGEKRLPHKLHHCHAYEVTSVDGGGRIHLRNPWNAQHPQVMTVKEFKDSMRARYTTLD
ncbi:hypothetical protein [Actinoallomurus sp. CA-150999]|uniref:hypothetical protein n=1 Tax=Actinoallomurus sp. CA-150999 TaxID=3239887 RepID=UPI003D8D5756